VKEYQQPARSDWQFLADAASQYRNDVIILTANPLKKIQNTTEIQALVANRFIYDPATLKRIMALPTSSPHGGQ